MTKKSDKGNGEGKSAKENAGAEEKPAEDSGKKQGLTELLRDDVEGTLIDWQGTPGRDEIRRKIMEAYWPGGSQTELLQWMVARTGKFQDRIKEAQGKGELHSWIVPASAAAVFESMFQGCVGVWLLASEPDRPDQLTSSVKDYIKLQARTFGTMVGS